MTRRRWKLITALVALLSATAMAALVWRGLQPTPYAQQKVAAVTMSLYGPPFSRVSARAEMSDPVAVSRLTAMLDRGWLTEPHACESVGYLLLKRGDGSQLTVHLLYGHDAENFEYSNGGVYRRIGRRDFLDAVSPFLLPAESLTQPNGQQ